MTKNKSSVLITAANALLNKYILFSLIAVIIVLAAVLSGYEDGRTMLWETLSAFLLITVTAVIQNLRLSKTGLDRRSLAESKKHLDPRIAGGVDDISGLGSTLSILAGISAAFAGLFIIDGGIFSLDSFALPTLACAAGALSKGVSLAYLTSQTNTLHLFSMMATACSDENKDEDRIADRAVHYPGFIRQFGISCTARLTASVSLCIAVIICSFGGAGAPFSCFGTALLTVISLLLTGIFPKFDKGDYTEEKLPLWTRERKSYCVCNAVLFAVITFVFMFSFPIQSVYSTYEPSFDFEYNDNITAKVNVISAPERIDDNAPLFIGFFAVSALFVIITSACADTEKADFSIISSSAFLGGAVVVFAYIYAAAVLYPACVLDPLMIIVTVSFGCLILGVNLIFKGGVIRSMKKKGHKNENTDI